MTDDAARLRAGLEQLWEARLKTYIDNTPSLDDAMATVYHAQIAAIQQCLAELRAAAPAQAPPAPPDGFEALAREYRLMHDNDGCVSFEIEGPGDNLDVMEVDHRCDVCCRFDELSAARPSRREPSDLIVQIRALRRWTSTINWITQPIEVISCVKWDDLEALLPPEDGQP